MASVEFRNVTKQFDNGLVALKHFNLVVEDGELLVLVGASGCGKSTALRLLAGLESPSDGEVLIDKRVVNQETPQQRNIAMVFQNYALYPHMTVRGNLEFPLQMSHATREDMVTRVSEIAELLGLADLLGRKPAQLSGGQRQRVSMGRALVRDPSVFLLDEPLSNLDAKLRAQIRADIAQIQKRLKKTTVYVTHDQVEAMTLGDRVAVLAEGELQQIGTPEQLYNHPSTVFVAQFIGSPGMNIVPCWVTTTDKQVFKLKLAEKEWRYQSHNQQLMSALAEYAEQTLYIGFRPEALSLTPCEKAMEIKAKVITVEYLGHESLVYLTFPGSESENGSNEFTARLQGQITSRAGDVVTFYIEFTAFCFFNEKGENIFHTQSN
ncbi:ABC transporter ATP-binding protein [Kaarinaea lacus]